jgi:hypothetical protein
MNEGGEDYMMCPYSTSFLNTFIQGIKMYVRQYMTTSSTPHTHNSHVVNYDLDYIITYEHPLPPTQQHNIASLTYLGIIPSPTEPFV